VNRPCIPQLREYCYIGLDIRQFFYDKPPFPGLRRRAGTKPWVRRHQREQAEGGKVKLCFYKSPLCGMPVFPNYEKCLITFLARISSIIYILPLPENFRKRLRSISSSQAAFSFPIGIR
jgi:hypothetical protein